ncbi:MAG: tripartite tricarboxylate transporter substrate binding protein [Ideonella sp.]|nr:tripartite tricarboxylate transporter substrate binding protein [Ideonella sp.]
MNRHSAARRGIVAAVSAFAFLGAALAQGGDAAGKPITIVVPFPPGGTTDQLARAIGQQMGENLKVPVIIDNRPGGGAQIAANVVKQAGTDGTTIFIGDIGALSFNPYIYAKLSYDPLKDFTPLARLVMVPQLLIVPAASPYATLADVIKAAQTKPGGLSIASQGNGTGGHVFAEMLRRETQGQLNHIPYRGSAPALTDMIGGQVDLMFDAIGTSGPFVKDGKLRALAVGAPARVPMFAQVATLQELGYPQLNMVAWFGMVVKAGTPAAVVQRLGDEVIKALQAPQVAKRFTDQGLDVAPLAPQEFKPFMEAEAQRWSKVIKDAGIRIE